MKKFVLSILTAIVCLGSAVCFTACEGSDSSAVRLVSVSAVEVGVRGGIDYFVVPEPAASTKVNAISGLDFAGDLQNLYGGGGYPQAVVVAKKEIANHYFAQVFADKLKSGAAVYLTVARYAGPLAETYDEVGVPADYEVAYTAEIDKASTMGNPEIDNQLRRAMEIAATTIKTEATS